MLKQLYIKNFTLIEELDIPFHPGFSVITGETGAGKSIILGAIGLLLGNRADTKQIKTGKDRCTIEAHFDLSHYHLETFFRDNDIDYDATDCIIRREINASGKSRGFINDTPVPLTLMKDLGNRLIDIHSQHQNLLLNKEDFQLSVVDIIAQSQALLEDYQTEYSRLRSDEKKLQALEEELRQSQANEEFMRFQFNELDQANLHEGEDEELEERYEMLSHAEEIKMAFFETDNILLNSDGSVVDSMKTAVGKMQEIERVYTPVHEIAERMNSLYIELKDLAQEVSQQTDRIDFDPAELDRINERLDLLNTLLHKHRVDSVAALIGIRDQLNAQLSLIDNSDEKVQELKAKIDEQKAICNDKARKLSAQRAKAATQVEKEILKRLVPMGIPHARFQVDLSAKPLSVDGADRIAFLFSANTNTLLQPITQVASGGEIARVMLALKALISGAVKLPTIIFDEIDTGVSGRVAEQMAQIMQEMGCHNRQVISITHLPQIAAMGTSHYKVQKEETPNGTNSQMKELTTQERVTEIAQMLSGSNVTEAAISNARELLKLQ